MFGRVYFCVIWKGVVEEVGLGWWDWLLGFSEG